MSTKKKSIAIVVTIIAAIVVLIAVNGFEFNIFGVVTLTTKNYATAKEAYLAENDAVDEIKDIMVVEADDYNGFYIAYVGEDSLLVCQMKITDSKYYCLGSEIIYDLANGRVDGIKDGKLESTITSKLISRSTYGGNIEWALIKACDAESVAKNFNKVEINATIGNEPLVFVYRIDN